MNDITYTATGNFSTLQVLDIHLVVPSKLPNDDKYQFNFFDLSRDLSDGTHCNAVYCHLDTESHSPGRLQASTAGPQVKIRLNELTHFDANNTSGFEQNEKSTFFFVLHNNKATNDQDIQQIYDHLEYIKEKYTENTTIAMDELYMLDGPTEKGKDLLQPRRLGISIIAK